MKNQYLSRRTDFSKSVNSDRCHVDIDMLLEDQVKNRRHSMEIHLTCDVVIKRGDFRVVRTATSILLIEICERTGKAGIFVDSGCGVVLGPRGDFKTWRQYIGDLISSLFRVDQVHCDGKLVFRKLGVFVGIRQCPVKCQ